MIRHLLIIFSILFSNCILNGESLDSNDDELSNVSLYAKTSPSVIGIYTKVTQHAVDNQTEPRVFLSTGTIIHPNGKIIAPLSTLGPLKEFQIYYQNRFFDASLVDHDPITNLALIKIHNVSKRKFFSLELEHNQPVDAGSRLHYLNFSMDFGAMIGSTMATSPLLTRNNLSFFTTEHAVNPTYLGTLFINNHGNLVGIHTMTTHNGPTQNVGVIIPSSTIAQFLKTQLHIWHGLDVKNIPKEAKKYLEYNIKNGVLVRNTVFQSPSFFSGLLPGDIITKINREVVDNSTTFYKKMGMLHVGDLVEIQGIRSNQKFNISFNMTKLPKTHDPYTFRIDFGVLKGLVLKQSILLTHDEIPLDQGIIVEYAPKSSQDLGIQKGDQILRINDIPISSIHVIYNFLHQKITFPIDIRVRRDGTILDLKLRP
jgi:S1-C subfamily serine protease